MKKKQFKTKLNLNKQTITALNDASISKIFGGGTTDVYNHTDCNDATYCPCTLGTPATFNNETCNDEDCYVRTTNV